MRGVDAAWAALEATAAPLRRATFGRSSTQLTEIRAVASAARQSPVRLAAQVERAEAAARALPWPATPRWWTPAARLRTRWRGRAAPPTGSTGATLRCSALVALALDRQRAEPSPVGDALRDLTLLDGALARLAAALDMAVTDLDTVPDVGTAPAQTSGRPTSAPSAATPRNSQAT